MAYQVGTLHSRGTNTALKTQGDDPWILKGYPRPSSVALVRGTIQGGEDGTIWAVEEASSANNSDRWAPISSGPSLACGGSNGFSLNHPSHTVTNGSTTEAVNGALWLSDRLGTVASTALLSTNVTGLTLASADTGIYLFSVSWEWSADPNAILTLAVLDNTAPAILTSITVPAGGTHTKGDTIMALIRKASGTAMELLLAVYGSGVTNSPVMQNIRFNALKLGALDPNELATANGNATSARPEAP